MISLTTTIIESSVELPSLTLLPQYNRARK